MLNLNEIPVSESSNEPLPLIPDGTIVRGVLMFEGGDHIKPEFSQILYICKGFFKLTPL